METTLNIHREIMEKITFSAHARKISRSEIMRSLIRKILEEHATLPLKMGRLVRYQEKCAPEEWHRFHITLREDEYEYCLDLRKILKMSLSCILAFAVKRYIEKKNYQHFTDNNRFINYVVVKEVVRSLVCWKFYWGYSPRIMASPPAPKK
ncbi:MAG: hypothetical protein JW838_02175 [Spirochaetes bacterium]|nr:hypothetical protein [Spirochaetota bacterium]